MVAWPWGLPFACLSRGGSRMVTTRSPSTYRWRHPKAPHALLHFGRLCGQAAPSQDRHSHQPVWEPKKSGSHPPSQPEEAPTPHQAPLGPQIHKTQTRSWSLSSGPILPTKTASTEHASPHHPNSNPHHLCPPQTHIPPFLSLPTSLPHTRLSSHPTSLHVPTHSSSSHTPSLIPSHTQHVPPQPLIPLHPTSSPQPPHN